MRHPVPSVRLRAANDAPVRPERRYVLYWMIAARRTRWSFSLQRAVERSEELGLPLVVFEPLRCGYRWASPRIHTFVTQGMSVNRDRLADAGVAYFPYVEGKDGDGSGLLEALAKDAAVVITDDFPCFFLPRMVAAAAEKLDVHLEAVDSNGVMPLAATPKAFSRAFDFRRFLHKHLLDHIDERPEPRPLAGADVCRGRLSELVRQETRQRWAPWTGGIDHVEGLDAEVAPIDIAGGAAAGEAQMHLFLDHRLPGYGDRNHPDTKTTSELSPYLHFGHVSASQLIGELLDEAEWTAPHPPPKPTGARAGWWGLSEAEEGFLDEAVTWRETSYTFCHHEPRYDQYDSLPNWALTTMDEHRDDDRPELYSLDELEHAKTSDPIWNAAQRQLRESGVIHNYLRMLWAKRIYEWSPSPEEAWSRLEHMNNRWSIDGRNPNSYAGIGWVMGRFDRAWGPERPIFGKLRYMTSGSTKRKLKLDQYLQRWGRQGTLL